MTPETTLIWSWLNVLTKKRYDALIDVYGDLDTVVQHIDEKLLKSLGCRDETVLNVLNRLDEFDPDAYQQELTKRELTLISIEEDAYPSQLKEIGDPPVFLYYKGSLEILDQPCISLVGTRQMSSYGQRVTEHMIPDLVSAGVVTVSGLAQGIDAYVAKETIKSGGSTVAVLGNGLARIFPTSNKKLAEEIIEQSGLIISEFPLDTVPDKYTFPARNRIIAGLSLATVVLEAGEGSGALITADLALDYSRDVYAVPGEIFDPNFIGCHQIIASGQAKLVTSPADILRDIGIVSSQTSAQSRYQPQNNEEEMLITALTTMPQSVTELQKRSQLPTGTINAALTMMELAGAVKNVGEGKWVKKT